MEKIKKFSMVIMAVIMAATMLIPSHKAYAASGSMSITAPGEATIGQNITVVISMSSTVPILAMQFNFNYNAELFDYVSSEGAEVGTTSPSGAIPFRDESSGKNKYDIKVVLKPKAIGTANFSATDVVALGVEDGKSAQVKLQPNSPTTQVMAEPETEDPTFSDATLSSLSIAEASLNEPFAKWTINYSCNVPYDVTVIHISANSSQGGKTEVGGPYTNLAVGNNVITVKSYAKSGKVMTYTINVNRASAPVPDPEPVTEPATEPETETETETEPVKNTTVTIDGKEYVISKTFPEKEIPDGYKAGTVDINGDTVGTAESDVTGLCLVYLTDADDNSVIYLYNKDSKEFEKYITFKSGKNIYVYLDASQAENKPEGMAETECEIQGSKVKVYTQDTDSEFVYFYAVNSKGERIWYVYDTVEKTIQRKNSDSSQTDVTDGALQDELDSLKQDNDKLTQDKDHVTKVCKITFIAAGVVIVALIVLIVVMAAHKSEEKHSVVIPDEGDYDYDNEEDDAQSEPDALLAAADEKSGEEAVAEEQAATQEPVLEEAEENEEPAEDADAAEKSVEEPEKAEDPDGDLKKTEPENVIDDTPADASEELVAEEPDAEPEEFTTEELDTEPEEPVEEESAAISEDDFAKVDEDVTQADMDAFVAEAQQLENEPLDEGGTLEPEPVDEDEASEPESLDESEIPESAGEEPESADADDAEIEPEITELEPDDEPSQQETDAIKPLADDEDGLEIETEIIDLGDDIFDDDEETAAAKEQKKEPEVTEEEPETIELEPVDGDDEEYFL